MKNTNAKNKSVSALGLFFALALSACGVQKADTTARANNSSPNTIATSGGSGTSTCPKLNEAINFSFAGDGSGSYLVAGTIPSNDPYGLSGQHGSVTVGQASNQSMSLVKSGGSASLHLGVAYANATSGSGTLYLQQGLINAMSGLTGSPASSCVQSVSIVAMPSGNSLSFAYFYLGMSNGYWYGPIGVQ